MQQKTGAKESNAIAIIGLILAVILPPVGLVVSIVTYQKFKSAKKSVTLPIISIAMALLIIVSIYLPLLAAIADKGFDQGLQQLLVE